MINNVSPIRKKDRYSEENNEVAGKKKKGKPWKEKQKSKRGERWDNPV